VNINESYYEAIRMSGATVENRRFGMNPNLLMDVIRRQAGTLQKGILEAVMNAVDAKATEINIQLNCTTLVVQDNGTGMTDRSVIERYFETFGQPPDEGEQKWYGQFRLGRGQIMAFGVNLWETGPFAMSVDIAGKGLDYVLEERAETLAGCRITVELYEPLLPAEKARVERELAVAVKYVPAKVLFNGERLSVDTDDIRWDHDTDQAFIKLKDSGNLYIYNLGVLVCSHPGHVFGCGGEVVSKQQLKVNFARNEVMSSCPVWKKIRPLVDQLAASRAARQGKLTDATRQNLIDRLKAGELAGQREDWETAKIFQDVSGRYWSLRQIQRQIGCAGKLAAAQRGDTAALHAMAHKLGFVLCDATLEEFGVKTVGQLVKTLDANYWHPLGFAEVKLAELTKALSAHFELIEEDKQLSEERVVLEVLRHSLHTLGFERRYRMQLVLGDADRADSWTDGSTHIALNRKLIKQFGTDLAVWIQYGQILIYNLCCDRDNREVDDHSPEFWQLYAEKCDEVLSRFVDRCVQTLPGAVERLGRKLTKDQERQAEKLAKVQSAGKELDVLTRPSAN
jgi:hypothetical protein